MQDGFMAHIDTQKLYNMRRGLTQEGGAKGKGVLVTRKYLR